MHLLLGFSAPVRCSDRSGKANKVAHKRYVPSLDGLRAVAILLVMLHHLSDRRLMGGQIGVDIFFVLSGALITRVLCDEWRTKGRISLPAFFIRRVLRLGPALVVVVMAEAAVSLAIGSPDRSGGVHALAALTYATDLLPFFGDRGINVWGHSWSLAVEEHFYIIWPFVLLLLLRVSPPVRLVAVAALFVGLMVWRVSLVLGGAAVARTDYTFDGRAAPMVLGCAVALWSSDGVAPALRNAVRSCWPAAIIALVALAFSDVGGGLWLRCFAYGIAGAATAVIILEIGDGRDGPLARTLAVRPLVALGAISYGVYLWHWPALLHLRQHSGSPGLAALCLMLSVGAAALSYRWVEKPFLRLKARFEPVPEALPRPADPLPQTPVPAVAT